MIRFLIIIVCLAAGAVAGWQVLLNLADILEAWWIPYAAGGATVLVVLFLLYLPLGRPIADVIDDRLSAMRQRMKKTTSGVGFDEIPVAPPPGVRPSMVACQVCGGPGGPLCPACAARPGK